MMATVSAHKHKLEQAKANIAAMHAKFDEAKHKRGAGGKFQFQGGPHKPGEKPEVNVAKQNANLGPGKTSDVVDTDVIKMHVNYNPKKPGSKANSDFAKYQDGMTVGEFKSAVGNNAEAKSHIVHDVKKGFITVHDPKTLPKQKTELTKSEYIAAGKTSDIKGSDVIKLHPIETVGHNANPKKPGSKANADFAKYKDEMTVDQFTAAVGDKSAAKSHIVHDIKKGHISVHDPNELKAMRTGETAPPKKAEPAPAKTPEPKPADHKAPASQAEAKAQAKAASKAEPISVEHMHPDTVLVSKKSGLEYKVSQLKADDNVHYADQKLKEGTWEIKKGTKPGAEPKPEPKDAHHVAPTHKVVEPDKPHKIKDLNDQDILVSATTGNEYKVGKIKDAGNENYANKKLASGEWTVKGDVSAPHNAQDVAAAKTAAVHQHDIKSSVHDLPVDTVLTVTGSGHNMTVDKYIETHTILAGISKKEAVAKLQADVDKGFITVAKPGTSASKAGEALSQPAVDVKKLTAHDEIHMLTQTNPYPKPSKPQGSALSPEEMNWVKYQAIDVQYGKQMSYSAYMKTAAGTPDEKHASLQDMVNQGHVKIITAAEKVKVQAEKQKVENAKLAEKHKAHFEQVKETYQHEWKDDPKWGKAPGVHDLENATSWFDSVHNTQFVAMKEARQSMGLKFTGIENPAVSFYTGTGYSSMNSALRNGNNTDSYKGKIKALDGLMEKTKGDAIMWRGIGSDYGGGSKHGLNDMPPPQEFIDNGYTSISYNPRISTSFGGQSKITGKSVLFRVRVPKGTTAAFVGRKSNETSALKDEAEVITARGTRYKYVSTTHGVNVGGNSNMTIIDLEIVSHDGSPIQG